MMKKRALLLAVIGSLKTIPTFTIFKPDTYRGGKRVRLAY